VGALAKCTARGIEETARDQRYNFLGETARALGIRTIVLAHTADDQAETILHHIVRGTGLSGLRGIPDERKLGEGIRLIRPLLSIERRVVLDYLASLGQDYCEDETNRDESYTRNRIRRQLLPLLEREYNPHISEALRRLGRQAAESQAALDALAVELLERVLETGDRDECRLKWRPLAAAPRHLVREVLAQLWRRQGWPRQKMGFDQWEDLARIALQGGAATFPGKIEVRREGRQVVLRAHSVECD
jgi:tRNA(Ile)-lysidine synthase